MRVVLDGMPLTELKSGVGTYSFELASALATGAPQDEFELVSPRPFLPEVVADRRPSNLTLVYSKPNAIHQRWWTVGLPSYLRRSPPALFHGTNFEVPMRTYCPAVVTIHDLSWLLHSSTHEARAVVRGRLRLPLMARKATAIITPSERVRGEVCEVLKIDRARVFAVPLAPRTVFAPLEFEATLTTRRRLGIEDEFLLFVGTIEPRKNLVTLLRAFEEVLRTTEFRPQLIIAGKPGWKQNAFLSQLGRSGIRDRVKLIGYVSDADLRCLYSSCRAFVYPSIYEGFGLPPLEAMACGAPVITSAVPSVIENSDQPAARLVSPTDIHELARNIVDMLADAQTRQHLSAAALKHVSNFSWDQTATLTRAVYAEAFKRRSD